jgi:hypothetical protein
MIVLAVMTYNGAATEPVEASFDELGGTIGRADGNLMVLPDPERTISRVHAKVVFRNGTYAIEDRGSNPILVNGNVVGHGKEWPLAPGDVVQIGGYELGVRASGSPAASDDPFADVFAAHDSGGSSTAGSFATSPMPPPSFAASARLHRSPPHDAPRRRRRRVRRTRPPAIPSDWDPLADETATGLPGSAVVERDPGGLMGPGGTEESIDDLFGLGDKGGKGAKPGHGWPDDDDFLGVFDAAGPASGGVGERVAKPRKEDARIDHMQSSCRLHSRVRSRRPWCRHRRPRWRRPSPCAHRRRQRLPRRCRNWPRPPSPGAVRSCPGTAAPRQATIVAPSGAARRNGVLATVSGGTRPGIRRKPRRPPRRGHGAATVGRQRRPAARLARRPGQCAGAGHHP